MRSVAVDRTGLPYRHFDASTKPISLSSPRMKLSEMKEAAGREEIQLTKSLGQNFLHDGNQLRRIVGGRASPSDKVLEIGPGLGPLTELLVERRRGFGNREGRTLVTVGGKVSRPA